MLARKCLLVGILTLLSLSLAISAQPVHPTTGEPLVIDCLRGTPDAIDGDLSDWNLEAMTPATLDAVEQLNSGQENWTGPEDCGGEFYLLWDDENIYIAAVVKDDTLSMNKTDASIWNSDCIEVLFSTTDAVADHSWANPTIHYQYGFNANNQKWNWCSMEAGGQIEPDYLQTASSITADGYICEVSIRHSEITSLDFSAGSILGFHPCIDDADVDAGDTEFQMTWTGIAAHDQSLGYEHMILSADSVPEPEDPNPVGWWPLDDGAGTTAVDASGNGHDGTLLLDPQWVEGNFGGALEFAGLSGQRVEMEGYEGILGTQNRTVMAWIKTTEMGDWISWGQNTNTQKWIGRINDNAGNGAVGAYRTEVSGGYIISTTVLTDGEWHHVTSVLESDGSPTVEDVKMYVDGALEAVSGFRPVGIDTVGGRNVWIGDGHHDRPWLGPIDDVRIYNRALTELEIVAAMEGVERVDMEIGFGTPVIDGEVDYVWEGASTQHIVPQDDPANASGSWKALYDSENLYVIADISDDSLMNDSASSYLDDSVEFYFDGGNTKDGPPLSGDNRQYTFGWATDEVQGTNTQLDGVEHVQVDTDTGWRIEIKLPWLSIQGTMPEARDLIGIDCFYNDDDDGGDSREAQIWTFATDGSAWNDASQWGTAVLGVIPEPVDPGTDGLVASYSLENDVLDGSGNELHGTIVGEPAFVEGQVGMALDFDGVDDVVELGMIDVVGGITLAAWIKPDDFEINDARVISKANEWGGNDHWWMLSTISETSLRFRLKTDDGEQTATLISDPVLEVGFWAHVAVTWNGGMMRIYKDGIEIASQEKGGTAVAVDPSVSAAIGSQPSDAFASDPARVVKFFDGLIDEVQIYERALSDGEIRYIAGERAVDPSLVIYYDFDEVGDIVADQSGKGHDGVVVGDVTAEASGMYNGAANFATGGYLDLDGPSIPAEDIPTSAMTLAAWINIANTGGDHEIFSARASDESWLIHPEPKSSGDIRWLLRSYGGTTIFQIRAGTVTWDQWLHFAGTYDKESGKAALYINGELIEELVVENPADIAGDWGLGARVGLTIDDARPFTGLMDEFRMYTRALSQDEILEIM